jgi:hypothetical protein
MHFPSLLIEQASPGTAASAKSGGRLRVFNGTSVARGQAGCAPRTSHKSITGERRKSCYSDHLRGASGDSVRRQKIQTPIVAEDCLRRARASIEREEFRNAQNDKQESASGSDRVQ